MWISQKFWVVLNQPTSYSESVGVHSESGFSENNGPRSWGIAFFRGGVRSLLHLLPPSSSAVKTRAIIICFGAKSRIWIPLEKSILLILNIPLITKYYSSAPASVISALWRRRLPRYYAITSLKRKIIVTFVDRIRCRITYCLLKLFSTFGVRDQVDRKILILPSF